MKTIIVLLCVMVLLPTLKAQEKLSFNGYISNMGQSVIARDTADEYRATWDLIIHNRINVAYYANDNFTAHLQFRNQFMWGESVNLTPGYAQAFSEDKGWLDLNFNWFENRNNFLNTQVDRAYLEYVKGNLELSLGRQRINWGRTLVWNPNDIFNAFSFYDFDYMERPGSDALRAKYYLGTAASAEIVAKIDSANNLTLAGLWKTNTNSYDLQLLAGYVNSEDFVIGTGWEGNIKSLGFRGEMNYYRPEKNFSDTAGSFLATLSMDYLLPKSIMLQVEFLYNDSKNLISLADPNAILRAPPSSKNLSFSEYNLFANISWPAMPILTLSMASMYYTDYHGYFLMPGADFSLNDNLYFALFYQYFNLEVYNPILQKDERVGTNMAFARLKWNF